eukprot:762550-Hanusia_phi.AAC.1
MCSLALHARSPTLTSLWESNNRSLIIPAPATCARLLATARIPSQAPVSLNLNLSLYDRTLHRCSDIWSSLQQVLAPTFSPPC